MAEFRRTLTVLWIAVGAFFGFLPFLGNLLLSFVIGGRFRRQVRELLADTTPVPVDEPPDGGRTGKVYLIAGEDSGDMHAAELISSLRGMAGEVEVGGMGGPRMEAAGARLDYDLVRMNVMGLIPVLRTIPVFFGLFRDLLRRLETDPPDVLVPVDYPGFNLRAARLAKKRGVRVVYYVLPQVWAWAPWRVRRIARCVDRVLLILPFERPIVADRGIEGSYVGHPLFEHLNESVPARGEVKMDRPPRRIGILPGSRRAEVRTLLPDMLAAAREVAAEHRDVTFVLPYQRPTLRGEIDRILAADGEGLPVEVIEGRTHETMRDLDLAMVASGTATLELAYYRVPMVALYRLSRFGALMKRFILITPHIVLVNIVAGDRVIPELVGAGDLASPAAAALDRWLRDADARNRTIRALDGVRSRLLCRGTSDRAAGWVLAHLDQD